MSSRAERANAPFRLNLEQQKRRAKDLHRDLKAGSTAALARLRAYHPKFDGGAAAQPLLADAQLVIARELGLSSWPKLKAHIEAMEEERASAAAGHSLDQDVETLHVRCGTDIEAALAEAGFSGRFLEYSDPLVQGPVTHAADLVSIRAGFLADAYGENAGFTFAEAIGKLQQQETGLAEAARNYERVVLWFEHDSFDQLVLVRCLAKFAAFDRTRRLELISADNFPGGQRFIGLGELPPEALRLLWAKRQPVTAEQLALGSKTWDALRSPDPQALAAILRTGTRELPHLAPALRRHLQELPWMGDGLSLTERLTLEIVAEGSRALGDVFALLVREREPLPWLGDIMFMHIVEDMLRAAEPALSVVADAEEGPWPARELRTTEAGRAVLAGKRDWLSLSPPERWVGGVAIRPGGRNWRWDAPAQGPVLV